VVFQGHGGMPALSRDLHGGLDDGGLVKCSFVVLVLNTAFRELLFSRIIQKRIDNSHVFFDNYSGEKNDFHSFIFKNIYTTNDDMNLF